MAHDQDRPSQRGGTKETNPGNFANDRERASRAGQKGGQNSGATSPMIEHGLPKPGAGVARTATAVAATHDCAATQPLTKQPWRCFRVSSTIF